MNLFRLFNLANILRFFISYYSIGNTLARPVKDVLNCNQVNYEVWGKDGIYPNKQAAKLCSSNHVTRYFDFYGHVKNIFQNPVSNTMNCKQISAKAGKDKGFKNRVEVKQCPIGDNLDRVYVFSEQSYCPPNPQLPCQNEELSNYHACNGINYLAGQNAILNPVNNIKLPTYESLPEAYACLPESGEIFYYNNNKLQGPLNVTPDAFNTYDKDCRKPTLEAGLQGYFESKAKAEECPALKKGGEVSFMENGTIEKLTLNEKSKIEIIKPMPSKESIKPMSAKKSRGSNVLPRIG